MNQTYKSCCVVDATNLKNVETNNINLEKTLDFDMPFGNDDFGWLQR